MKLNRRQFLKTSLISSAVLATPKPLLAASRPPLYIPPLLENRRGKPIALVSETIQTRLDSRHLVDVWGFNGHYLGPTVKVKQGDFVKMIYRNGLSQAMALNIQGLQVASELLGGVGHSLKPNQSWSPIVPITQSAAMCFYHSCTLASSAYQSYRGLVGMWLIDDEESRKLALPNKYGVNDIPLILQDLQLNNDGMQLFQQNENHFQGNRLFVNGQEAPFLNVARGWVRLRLVNASISRSYELRCDDEREMLLIAKQQGFLPQAKSIKSIFLGVGERVELLINLNEGENVALIVGKKRNFIDKTKLFFHSDGELADNTVLELRPEGLKAVFNDQQQQTFPNTATLPHKITQERAFHLDTSNAMLNQKRFDPRRIDVNAKVNSIERWTLTSSSPTGFRIQGARFLIESQNGVATPESEIVWQDTVWINGKTQILVEFNHLSSSSQPFIFGASDLMLADKGALGLMVVQ
ncbi:MAG: multicopper oxidase domain-containing protein [Pasteurellaceae bacterium]|nr:multicopper oxidase domain-containing protein [Pasteurellaceae bacterium]